MQEGRLKPVAASSFGGAAPSLDLGVAEDHHDLGFDLGCDFLWGFLKSLCSVPVATGLCMPVDALAFCQNMVAVSSPLPLPFPIYVTYVCCSHQSVYREVKLQGSKWHPFLCQIRLAAIVLGKWDKFCPVPFSLFFSCLPS